MWDCDVYHNLLNRTIQFVTWLRTIMSLCRPASLSGIAGRPVGVG